MKPATDPTVDYKQLVRAGYDRCADRYNVARGAEPPSGLDLLTKHLRAGASVLDIGCGAGIPIAKSLAAQFSVTGVDFSTEQIRRARLGIPEAKFIQSDIMAVRFLSGSFDAAVAFFVLFHLPRDQQLELLQLVHTWLVSGGLLLATVSVFNEPPYIEDDFFGAKMYWTNFAEHEYHDLLRSLGYEILSMSTVPDRFSHRHPLVLARKDRRAVR
jgi:cyclopropane fatty-acyl-phospholipid synthase-like methyltransferase